MLKCHSVNRHHYAVVRLATRGSFVAVQPLSLVFTPAVHLLLHGRHCLNSKGTNSNYCSHAGQSERACRSQSLRNNSQFERKCEN